MRRAKMAGLVLALVCSGCRFDAALPPGSVVVCSAEAPNCPGSDLICSVPLGRCVPLNTFDEVPPEVVLRAGALTLIPPPGSPLASVTRLGLLGRARIIVDASEPLADLPRLSGQPRLDCLGQPASPTSFTFDCQLPPDTAAFTGPCTVSVELKDLGANLATRTLDGLGLVVDTEPPARPRVDDDGAVLLVRMPWGSLDAGSAAQFRVVATALEPETMVLARSGTAELSRTAADSAGRGTIELGKLDLDRVDLEVFDQAGNASPRATVRDVEWVAALGQKRSGDLRSNPHRLDGRRVHGAALAREDALEFGASDGVDLEDGLGPSVAGAWTWESRRSLEFPERSSVFPTPSVFDPRRARVIRLPPLDVNGTAASTLGEWNGTTWLEIAPTDPELDGNPVPRKGAAMIYDPLRDRTVIFGGAMAAFPGFGTTYGDTWSWNGNSWRQLFPRHAPTARTSPGMAWDPVRGEGVLFGGATADGGTSDETWLWNGVDWEALDAGAGPSQRAEPSMAWDPLGQRVILFGGTRGASCAADLWSLTSAGWEQLDAGPGPTPRCSAAFAAGPDGKLLLAGGQGSPGLSTLAIGPVDAWTLQPGGWSLAMADAGMTPQGQSALVLDSSRDELLVVPRELSGFSPARQPLRVWDGTQFAVRAPLLSAANRHPRDRTQAVMAWSPQWKGVVAFGGVYGDGGWSNAETWIWANSRWTPVIDGGVSGGPSPSARAGHAMAAAPGSGELVLRGGGPGADESWAFSLAGWRRETDAGLQVDGGPSIAYFSALVPWQGGLLSLPENFRSDFSVGASAWDLMFRSASGQWSLYPGSPESTFTPQFIGAPLADGRIALIGNPGGSSTGGVFGSTGFVPNSFPVPSQGPCLAFEPKSGATVLFGGSNSSGEGVTETRAYTDAGWLPVALSDPENDGAPGPRIYSACAADPERGRVVLYSGKAGPFSGPGQTYSDLWEAGTWGTRPSFVYEVDLLAARIPSGATARSISVHVNAGGNGEGAGGPQPGFDVQLWRAGRWVPWGQGPASASSPGPLELSETNPQVLRTLVDGWPSLAVAVAPTGASAATPASVRLDAVEVRVRYRLR